MARTTIQLDKNTRDALKSQKLYKNETFDNVIRRLMQKDDSDDELSEKTIKRIEESVRDIRAGRVLTTEQLNRELGL